MIQYGIERVKEPTSVLPASAWRLDNSRQIRPDEMRIALRKIHLEGTSFKQIVTESHGIEEKIKQNIIDIVIRRGKFHNPVTGTGGIAFGVIEQIGPDFRNERQLAVGDFVIINASLSSIPMHIENIPTVNYAFNQITAEGYAIVHDKIPLFKIDEGESVDLLMLALDESGNLFRSSELARNKGRILVIGNNLVTNLLYGCAIRKSVGQFAEITCLLDKNSSLQISGGRIDELLQSTFNDIRFLDILKPIECVDEMGAENFYDLSINCAEIPGAETVNILATRPGGTILFANLINNLSLALYITESTSKPVNVFGAEGYVEGYEEFDQDLINDIESAFVDSVIEPPSKNVDEEANPYNASLIEKAKLEDFVFRSAKMQSVMNEITRVSKYDCNVIIFGDTGVGKEKVANMIQKNSERKMQPFVKINCGAISPNLIESEFFGYEKGAFTGANAGGKKGYFEVANNGVIFLDEIGELPLEMQAKLLRAIQDGEFYRVGGTTPVKTNVRIISATNRDLEQFVEEGKFRRDLYYRLNVVPIKIPKLEDRPDDIPVLVEHFLRKYGEKFKAEKTLSPSGMDYLKKLSWPGNIRELENLVQRLIIGSIGDEITLMDVMSETTNDENFDQRTHISEKEENFNLEKAVNEYEKGLIKYACEKYGSTRKAAAAIGISQTQLVRKKKKYEL